MQSVYSNIIQRYIAQVFVTGPIEMSLKYRYGRYVVLSVRK